MLENTLKQLVIYQEENKTIKFCENFYRGIFLPFVHCRKLKVR